MATKAMTTPSMGTACTQMVLISACSCTAQSQRHGHMRTCLDVVTR